jgi:hypothetical protein
MTTPSEYQQYADQCLKAIWIARVPEVRASLLSMAKCWTELAERAERTAHPRAQPEKQLEPFEEKKPQAPSIKRRSHRPRTGTD